jgi:hypothetical protein
LFPAESAIPGGNLHNPVESISSLAIFPLRQRSTPRLIGSDASANEACPAGQNINIPSLIRSAPTFSLDDRRLNLTSLINTKNEKPQIELRLG